MQTKNRLCERSAGRKNMMILYRLLGTYTVEYKHLEIFISRFNFYFCTRFVMWSQKFELYSRYNKVHVVILATNC